MSLCTSPLGPGSPGGSPYWFSNPNVSVIYFSNQDPRVGMPNLKDKPLSTQGRDSYFLYPSHGIFGKSMFVFPLLVDVTPLSFIVEVLPI